MKKKGRGPSRKVASDTFLLIYHIRRFQQGQQQGTFPKGGVRTRNYIDKLILPRLLEHALSNRFDELYRASKKYRIEMLPGVQCSQARSEIAVANYKYKKVNGRPPTIKEWRAEYLAMRNPGYQIDMKTFRWIAKQTGLPWTRLRKVK
jgi:hypothetical protein